MTTPVELNEAQLEKYRFLPTDILIKIASALLRSNRNKVHFRRKRIQP